MTSPPPARRDPLAALERERAHLWTAASIILIALSLAVVIASWRADLLPAGFASALDVRGIRVALLLLSTAFISYALDRERTFRRLGRRLLDERTRAAELEARLREVTVLAEVAQALSGVADESDMQQAAVSSACRILEASKATLLVPDPSGHTLRPGSSAGLADGDGPGEVSLESGPLAEVARERRGRLLDASAAGRDGAIAVPLVAGDELIGVLWLSGRARPFGDYDLRRLELLAEQSAAAIANARTHEHERASFARLAEVDRLKTEFVASITHELKTPLTSLLGYATILRRRSDALTPEQREEFFAIIARQGERILRLIEELLQSQKLEAGIGRLRREPVNLRAIIESMVSDLETMAREHNVVVVAPAGDLGLYGDPTAIEHVITNLFDNALKYSPARSTIRISVDELESEVRVTVADEGIGIPADDLPHIFDRFHQAHGGGRGRGSVGLGLHIVRSLVEAHGGRVWVESEPNRGARFTFALPRRRRDDAARAEDEPEPPEQGAVGISAHDPIDFPA